MELLNLLTKRGRRWEQLRSAAGPIIMQAAGLQVRQHQIESPLNAAMALAEQYSMYQLPKDWREFGGIAFHVIAMWPPDLAYVIIYALRDIEPSLNYDPVPLLLHAVEMTPHLNPRQVELHLSGASDAKNLFNDSGERARNAAELLARELVVTPLRYAVGIRGDVDKTILPHLDAAIERFHPEAARLLQAAAADVILTPAGFLRCLYRLIFGRDQRR